jgi:hypothetical protein
MHGALEAWWRTKGSLIELEVALDWLRNQSQAEWNTYEIVCAEELMKKYNELYCNDGYKTKVVEVEFVAPLLNPGTIAKSKTFELSGKLDAVAKKESRYFLVEHKTTGDSIAPESDYWAALSIDGQVSGYFVGADASGYDCIECMYDVIKRPDLRPHKATPLENRKYTKDGKLYATQRDTDEGELEFAYRLKEDIDSRPDHYFQRRIISRSSDDMVDYMYDMWATAREIRNSQLSGRWPRNPKACIRFGRCEYFGVCTKCESIEDTSLFEKVENVHQEFSHTTNQKEIAV